MALIGLWHGASIFYLAYGLYFATIVMFYQAVPVDRVCLKIFGKKIGKILSIAFLFLFIPYGMIIFLVKTNQIFDYLSQFFQFFALPFSDKNISSIFLDLGRGLLIFALPILLPICWDI